MAINLVQTRKHLNDFAFGQLFIEELGWSQPVSRQVVAFDIDGATYQRRQIAHLAGAVVFEVTAADDRIPDANPRWRNAGQWARNSMVREGLLKADSPRGVWEITDKGRAALKEMKQ